MKQIIMSAFLVLYSISNFGQDWTNPINISNLDGYDSYPDMTIDKNGVMHCVWVHEVDDNIKKIYYSKSTDEGNTWNTPYDISYNETHKVMHPHIVSDTNCGLFVSYDYGIENPSLTQIHIRYYDGSNWGDSIVVTDEMPGAQHNRLTIDNNNRLYCFWFHDTNNGTIFYRYFENSVWSEVIIPYDDYDLYFLDNAVVDRNNNLFCAGVHHFEGESGYDDRIIYFDNLDGQWNDFYQLSDNTSWNGVDIDLDSEEFPHLTWWQYTSDTIPVTYGIFYSFYDGYEWSIEEQISEDSYNQRIQIVNDIPYILNWESGEIMDKIVLYRKIFDEWKDELVLMDDFIVPEVFINQNEKLHLVFFGDYENDDVDIYYMNRNVDTTVDLIENYKDVLSFSINPNPFYYKTNIVFNVSTTDAYVNLSIYTIQGKLIKQLIYNTLNIGQHKIIWDGTDNYGKKVNAKIYLVKLLIGNKIRTKLLMLNK